MSDLKIEFENGKAAAISFQQPDLINSELGVFLKGEKKIAILGEQSLKEGRLVFKPAIPFRPGQSYEIRADEEIIALFEIPRNSGEGAPKLSEIFPSTDTVPENLLKMYLQFSQPMQEVGEVLDYIRVVDHSSETEVAVFLKLESQLWNREHNRLTLWLDPGRIKTDLIPNRTQGLPLQQGQMYTITISEGWKSATAVPLGKSYKKTFFVAEKDKKKPDVGNWKLEVPASGTKKPLEVYFGEPMDAVLVRETLAVYTPDEKRFEGAFHSTKAEGAVAFYPEKPWKKGMHILYVDPKLEDLAGNNLNRLFDTDLEEDLTEGDQEYYSLEFSVE